MSEKDDLAALYGGSPIFKQAVNSSPPAPSKPLKASETTSLEVLQRIYRAPMPVGLTGSEKLQWYKMQADAAGKAAPYEHAKLGAGDSSAAGKSHEDLLSELE